MAFPREETLAAGAMSRRQMLGALASTSTLALIPWPGRAAADNGSGSFLKLSQQLTGKSDLNEDIAARMLAAFQDAGRGDDIAAQLDGAEQAELADDIVAAWYSGVSPDPDSAEVVSYQDALMWDAMDYTKPMAVCGGTMGYWADPPTA